VVGTFVPQVMMRYAAELVVDKRNDRAKGIVVTGVPVRQ
jgi:predicted MFS family arabinose efflux permease